MRRVYSRRARCNSRAIPSKSASDAHPARMNRSWIRSSRRRVGGIVRIRTSGGGRMHKSNHVFAIEPIGGRCARCNFQAGWAQFQAQSKNAEIAAELGVRQKSLKQKGNAGAPGEIRTPDLLLRRQSLYPTELRAHCNKFTPEFCAARTSPHPWRCREYSGEGLTYRRRKHANESDERVRLDEQNSHILKRCHHHPAAAIIAAPRGLRLPITRGALARITSGSCRLRHHHGRRDHDRRRRHHRRARPWDGPRSRSTYVRRVGYH